MLQFDFESDCITYAFCLGCEIYDLSITVFGRSAELRLTPRNVKTGTCHRREPTVDISHVKELPRILCLYDRYENPTLAGHT